MQVIRIFPKGFAANTYLVTEDGKSAVAIDPAQPRVAEEAEKRGLKVEYVLLTHGHFDHTGGCAALQAQGAKIGCSETEKPLATGEGNLAAYFSAPLAPFAVDFTFRDGETLDLCGLRFRVIATPGHTAGSVSFLCGDTLFTGDTLFAGDVGRTDLPTGSGAALVNSVKKLYALDGDYRVCPGHEEDTTLEEERRNNRYIRA